MDTYIKILKKACKIALAQKEWWALAALAGLVHTGAIFNMLLRSFLHLQPATELDASSLQHLSPFFAWIVSYARNLALLETGHLLAYIAVSLIGFAIIALLALTAQYILLFIISKGEKEISWKMIRKKLHHLHILRLFSINAVMKILLTIIIGLTTLALAFSVTESLFVDALWGIGIYAIALPLAFIVQIFGMLCLVQMTKKDASLGKIMHKVTNLLHNHWLAAFELALLLFIINFLTSGVLFVVLACFAILAGIAFEMALAVGSYILMSAVTFVSLLITAAIVLIYAGGITTFNYSAWTKLSDHLGRYPHFPVIEHALKKVLGK